MYDRRDEHSPDADILARANASTISADTLRFLGMLVCWKRPRHIFEFGSGLSTLFLARLQRKLGAQDYPALMSIDHSSRSLATIRKSIGPDHNVLLLHAPLAVTGVGGRVFTTYHQEYTRNIERGVRFDLVLIGGPPVYRYGREAPLYHLAPYLSGDALIILDNAHRAREQEALRNWRETWPGCSVAELSPGREQGLVVLSLGEAARIPYPSAEQNAAGADRVVQPISIYESTRA